jgi:hypothetical protein
MASKREGRRKNSFNFGRKYPPITDRCAGVTSSILDIADEVRKKEHGKRQRANFSFSSLDLQIGSLCGGQVRSVSAHHIVVLLLVEGRSVIEINSLDVICPTQTELQFFIFQHERQGCVCIGWSLRQRPLLRGERRLCEGTTCR